MRFTPHDYQRRAINFMLEQDHAGIFLDPGLGKTSISLSVAKRLKLRGKNKSVLVIAPLRPCYLVWPKEVEKWDSFRDLSYNILHGKKKDLSQKADIYIINPDGLKWLFSELRGKRDWPFDTLIVDESTKFKWTDTQRFKRIKHKLYKFKRRYILTGSAASEGFMGLFGQMWVMDEGATFGTKVGDWRNTYFRKSGYMGKQWKLRLGADKVIQRKIAPSVIQMSAEDYLELPELIINDILIDLPPAIMVEYKKMEAVFRSDFEDGRVTAANAAIMGAKCRQIASGGIYLDGLEREIKQLHYLKAEAVADILEELSGKPALIAYYFKHDALRLKKILGDDFPNMGTRSSMQRTKELETAWNNGELPGLMGPIGPLAHGLNLQESGGTVVYHTLTSKFEDYDQFIRRVWRQGNKSKSVIVHRILAKNTIDIPLAKSLESKDKTQKAFYKAIQEYWRNA